MTVAVKTLNYVIYPHWESLLLNNPLICKERVRLWPLPLSISGTESSCPIMGDTQLLWLWSSSHSHASGNISTMLQPYHPRPTQTPPLILTHLVESCGLTILSKSWCVQDYTTGTEHIVSKWAKTLSVLWWQMFSENAFLCHYRDC